MRARKVFVHDLPLVAIADKYVAAAAVDGVPGPSRTQLNRPGKRGHRAIAKHLYLWLDDRVFHLAAGMTVVVERLSHGRAAADAFLLGR